MADEPQDAMVLAYYTDRSEPVSFVVYDPDDGRIVQLGLCPAADFLLQQLLHPHNRVLEGSAPSIDGYVVRDGRIVAVEAEG